MRNTVRNIMEGLSSDENICLLSDQCSDIRNDQQNASASNNDKKSELGGNNSKIFADDTPQQIPVLHSSFSDSIQSPEVITNSEVNQSMLDEIKKLQRDIEQSNISVHNFANLAQDEAERIREVKTRAQDVHTTISRGNSNILEVSLFKQS